MNPGMAVKLRPTGPWRIGPDSGARNQVDLIYHSDSLFAAVSAAMSRFGYLEEWLNATARSAPPAVCFSSCFPFLEEIGFVIPPRTIWPPASPASLSARVRWKSARFVPLGIVQAILAGQTLDDKQWSVDGPSECLVPAGRPGPFRTSVRWSAAVDRLTGAAERYSTACIEFRPEAGLWALVSFADEAAQAAWQDKVKACFRLLADTGFGGERSRGWGRSEQPEFIEGTLPAMILSAPSEQVSKLIRPAEEQSRQASGADVREPTREPPVREPSLSPPVEEPPPAEPPAKEPVPIPEPPPPDPEPTIPGPEPESRSPSEAIAETDASAEPEASLRDSPSLAELRYDHSLTVVAPKAGVDSTQVTEPRTSASGADEVRLAALETHPEPLSDETPAVPEQTDARPVMQEAEAEAPAPVETPPGVAAHWLLSLFTPAAGDTVDWQRGNYSLLARGGRIESPAGAGQLKKQLPMVTEGSVVYATAPPFGSAPDVAPDGFAHPVFRAGFALSILLPEVR
jgi:CRISPR type III-A-associated RAMP protein Csm4